MKRAVLLMPYFGKLPPCIGYYLKSIGGRNFDVMFFSDLPISKYGCPANVHIVQLSFSDIVHLAANKIGVDVKMEHPKRLCNFRPMYGKIFEDYIKEYDYWGFGDCDLVYGNKMNEVLARVLNEGHDVLSFRKCWTSGPTCFVRNIEKNNSLYLRARNWKDVATMNEPDNPLFFDEVGGVFHNDLIAGKLTIADCEKIRDSFCAIVSRSPDIDYVHEDVLFEENIVGSYVHMLENGCLFAGRQEIPCFHFIGVKFRRYFNYAATPFDRVGEYWIDETGFYPSKALWRWRYVINPSRKVKALAASLSENGLRHWASRLRRLFK